MNPPDSPLQSLELDDAVERLLDQVSPVAETETVSLEQAAARVLAEPVYSPMQIPRDSNSAMDGYALRAGDLVGPGPWYFTRVGVSRAGAPWEGEVGSGECVRILTGAVLPAGADTVVIQEDVLTDADHSDRISVPEQHPAGDNIRYAGEEIRIGDRLLDTGRRLCAVDIGLLASVGIRQVCVRRPVRVGILSTGDELREPGEPLPTGCIYNSNLYMLRAAIEQTGAALTCFETGADRPELLRALLRCAATENDLLITSGGVSVGDADFVQQVLGELGAVDFWKLRMKPGKPLLFGYIGDCKVLGLPGNPVSAAVTFALVGRPLLHALAGQRAEPALRVRATLSTDLKKRPGRRDFQRGVLSQAGNGDWQVATTGPQGSHRLTSLTRANCLIDLPVESGSLTAGSVVDCLLLSELI